MNTKAPTPPPDNKTARPSAPPPPPPPSFPRIALSDLPASTIYKLADDIAEALSVGGRTYPNQLRHLTTGNARAIILDTLLKFKL